MDYDHEAFLGVEEAKKFDHLSVEESKKRLGYDEPHKNEIFHRIQSLLDHFSIVLIKIIMVRSRNKN